MNKDITCYFSWISDKNPWKEKKKKLVWIPRNSKYLIILSRFLFSDESVKILFILNFKQDSLREEEKRFLSEQQKILNILSFLPDSYFSDQSDKILFILNYRQESFFFPLLRILVWISWLKRILSGKQEKQESGKNDVKNVD